MLSPSGEIGRHSGLKIRRFVNSGRTGSIPVSGTIWLNQVISYSIKTRVVHSYSGFFVMSHHCT